jgi:hypothetical protein
MLPQEITVNTTIVCILTDKCSMCYNRIANTKNRRDFALTKYADF